MVCMCPVEAGVCVVGWLLVKANIVSQKEASLISFLIVHYLTEMHIQIEMMSSLFFNFNNLIL